MDSRPNNASSANDHGYEPSPYPLSILPRVRHAKPRPTVSTSDVPPTPLRVDVGDACAGGGSAEDDVGGEECNRVGAPHQHGGGAVGEAGGGKGDAPAASGFIAEASTRRRDRRKGASDSSASSAPPPIKPKMIEVVDVTDVQPAASSANKASPLDRPSTCASCRQHVARYACPKCGAPYCSVACYRVHDGTTDVDPSSSAASGDGGSTACTESFYRDRVLKSCEKEDGTALRGILARMHGDIHANVDEAERREGRLKRLLREGEREGDAVEGMRTDIKCSAGRDPSSALILVPNDAQMSDEHLAELAEYVLQIDDDGDDGSGTNRRILESIPPHLLHAFECALSSAEEASGSPTEMPSGKDAMGDAKPPEGDRVDDAKGGRSSGSAKKCTLWWVSGEAELDQADGLCLSDDAEEKVQGALPARPTLDDRILSLPPLPRTKTSTTAPLSYNILEVLYATSFAIRVGINRSRANAAASGRSRVGDPHIDDAALLLSQSTVLSHDARYDSLREAMMACSERLVENKKTLPLSVLRSSTAADDGRREKVISWDTLALDVAMLAYHRRYMLRMLFEALDICQLGADGIKSQLKKMRMKQRESGVSPKDIDASKREYEETKRKYKLASKKVEYFLSWCSSKWTAEMGKQLSDEVRAYVTDWQLELQEQETSVETLIRGIHSGDDRTVVQQMGGILELGGIGKSAQIHSPMEELMMSISTTRKKATE